MTIELADLSATQMVRAIACGQHSSVDIVRSCLDRIKQTDGEIKAWAFLDEEFALQQAKKCDQIRKSGRACGALHGVPVGLKDIIDTQDMPTQRGSAIFEGRTPKSDARIVENLRNAGAVIMGKTVTAELAFVSANQTRNPHNPDHSPGGSSSGSAAAVAANHVPLAIGTQTNGSVIRPASFCGVFGFKPSAGVISRSGLLQTSKTLDQVGCFGRDLADVALLSDAIGCYDQTDINSFPWPRPNMTSGVEADVPVPPDLAWLDLPFYDRIDEDAHQGLEAVLDILGPRVTRMRAADTLANLVAVQACIHEYEICQHQGTIFDAHWDQISEALQHIIKRARNISSSEYEDALEVRTSAQEFFVDFFYEFDAIIAPAATGEAPLFGDGTGDPVFCSLWTLAGLPCITLPLLIGNNGLPIGVQLIGPHEHDDRLLRTAGWMQNHLVARGE